MGVGFSYCSTARCSNADFDTDAYYFLLNFLAAYPEFSKSDFHISGESYAGFYVPHVADAVLTGNALKTNPLINLKSVIIGNGVGGTSEPTEAFKRQSDFWYGHVAYDYPDQVHIESVCDWNGPNGTISPDCRAAVTKAESGVGTYYVYNIYDTCDHDEGVSRKMIKDLTEMEQAQYLFAPVDTTNPSGLGAANMGYVCVLDSVSDHYLDDPSVQAAIHVTKANVTHWTQCGGREGTRGWELVKAHRQHMSDIGALAPNNALGDLYVKVLNSIPIVLYSGDVDHCGQRAHQHSPAHRSAVASPLTFPPSWRSVLVSA